MNIPQNIIDELIVQARGEAPDESCGYLLGVGDNVTENYPMENIEHSPEHFSFSPKDQFAALKYARSKGLKILANWHSHPAVATIAGGPPTGQRPQHSLCHTLAARRRAKAERFQDTEWPGGGKRNFFVKLFCVSLKML